jgi:hypothetical protein
MAALVGACYPCAFMLCTFAMSWPEEWTLKAQKHQKSPYAETEYLIPRKTKSLYYYRYSDILFYVSVYSVSNPSTANLTYRSSAEY